MLQPGQRSLQRDHMDAIDPPIHAMTAELEMPPGEYLKRQAHATFMWDENRWRSTIDISPASTACYGATTTRTARAPSPIHATNTAVNGGGVAMRLLRCHHGFVADGPD